MAIQAQGIDVGAGAGARRAESAPSNAPEIRVTTNALKPTRCIRCGCYIPPLCDYRCWCCRRPLCVNCWNRHGDCGDFDNAGHHGRSHSGPAQRFPWKQAMTRRWPHLSTVLQIYRYYFTESN